MISVNNFGNISEFSYLEIIALIFILIFICKLLFSLFRGFWTCFLGHFLGFGVKWPKGDNLWAVITGGTDGIGLEYAKQLAAKGFSLMIISRNKDKLKAVAERIKEQYSQCKEIKVLAVDFNRTDIYDIIRDELNKLQEIEVLVNNVGVMYHIPEYFTEIEETFNDSYTYVNMVSATKMLEIVLPIMVAKRSGIIINISSSLSDQPIPLYAFYAATKAYLTFLSEALSVENESEGVLIQTVLPNQVKTKMAKNIEMSYLSVSPEDFVSAAIKTVGIETCTYGHWKHKLLGYLFKTVASLTGRRFFMKINLMQLKKFRKEFYRQNSLNDTHIRTNRDPKVRPLSIIS